MNVQLSLVDIEHIAVILCLICLLEAWHNKSNHMKLLDLTTSYGYFYCAMLPKDILDKEWQQCVLYQQEIIVHSCIVTGWFHILIGWVTIHKQNVITSTSFIQVVAVF